MIVPFYLIGIFGMLPLLLQNCLPFGGVDFTAPAALQGSCGSTLQLHALRPRKRDFASSTCICDKLDVCKIQVIKDELHVQWENRLL
jgi:hypothetical protein